VTPGIAEHLDDEVGGAVHHLRLLREIVDRIDEAAQAHATQDTVEITAERAFRHGQDVEAAQPRRLLPLLERDLPAELADEAALAVPLANLAGDEQEVAAAHARDVICQRGSRLRQLDLELCETRLDPSRHLSALSGVRIARQDSAVAAR